MTTTLLIVFFLLVAALFILVVYACLKQAGESDRFMEAIEDAIEKMGEN